MFELGVVSCVAFSVMYMTLGNLHVAIGLCADELVLQKSFFHAYYAKKNVGTLSYDQHFCIKLVSVYSVHTLKGLATPN